MVNLEDLTLAANYPTPAQKSEQKIEMMNTVAESFFYSVMTYCFISIISSKIISSNQKLSGKVIALYSLDTFQEIWIYQHKRYEEITVI